MSRIRSVVLGLMLASLLPAQRLNPVEWSVSIEPQTAAPGARILARLTAKIQSGWHLYSLTTPEGGPIPTTVKIAGGPLADLQVYQPAPNRRFDKNFNLDTETFEDEVTLLALVQVAPDAAEGAHDVTIEVRNQSCDDTQCLPPKRNKLTAALTVNPAVRTAAPVIPAGYTLANGPSPAAQPAATASSSPASEAPEPEQDLAIFLLVAFGFGLAAIFTPCVFPMIPITMSYFLGQGDGKRSTAVVQATVFSLGIVVLFSILGLAVTAALGPFGVVQLGSNVWVNAFISAVFLAFGLSLLGAFEITIPSGLLTKLNNASQGGGILGTLVMGLTFSLAAFACVGPFMGTLLAASVQSGGIRPVLGMVSFAVGLALPFFFLALFPSYLKKLPRSGGWLARVKVVMGFVILAAMLKYLSTVDQVLHWGLLSRERFLSAWIVLFALAGLYLLGFLRMEGIKSDETLGLGRLLSGAVLLIFAISLLPGVFGSNLGELEPYVPPPTASMALASGGGAGGEKVAWLKDRYEEALAKARQENKNVFVNFTGYACTNCKWMKANMFTRPEIAQALRDYVLVELYTDGTDEKSESHQKLQESKFQTVAIPFYAILDPQGSVVATFPGLTRDPEKFLGFLEKGKAHQVARQY